MMQFEDSRKKWMQVSHEHGSDAFFFMQNGVIQDTCRMMQFEMHIRCNSFMQDDSSE